LVGMGINAEPVLVVRKDDFALEGVNENVMLFHWNWIISYQSYLRHIYGHIRSYHNRITSIKSMKPPLFTL